MKPTKVRNRNECLTRSWADPGFKAKDGSAWSGL